MTDPRAEMLHSACEDEYALVEFPHARGTWGPALHELLSSGLISFLVAPSWPPRHDSLRPMAEEEAHIAIDDAHSWDPEREGEIVVFTATVAGEAAHKERRFGPV